MMFILLFGAISLDVTCEALLKESLFRNYSNKVLPFSVCE